MFGPRFVLRLCVCECDWLRDTWWWNSRQFREHLSFSFPFSMGDSSANTILCLRVMEMASTANQINVLMDTGPGTPTSKRERKMRRDYNHNTVNNLNLNAGVCFYVRPAHTRRTRHTRCRPSGSNDINILLLQIMLLHGMFIARKINWTNTTEWVMAAERHRTKTTARPTMTTATTTTIKKGTNLCMTSPLAPTRCSNQQKWRGGESTIAMEIALRVTHTHRTTI